MIALAAVLVLFGAAAWRFSGGFEQPWSRLTVAWVVFQVTAVGSTTLLGLLGFFFLPALIGLGLLLLTASVLVPQRPRQRTHGLDDIPGLALLTVTLAVWTWRAGLHESRLSYDDTTYHAALPAAWITEGSLHVVPFTYQSTYPWFAELLTTFFMLPTHDLTHVGLAPLVHAFTLSCAVLAVAERNGWHRGSAAGFVAALLISRRVYQLTFTSTAADLGVAGLVVAAAALCFTPTPTSLFVAGLAAGAALSTKVSVAVPLGVLGLYVLITRPRQAAWFALPSIVLGLPFYVHNLWLTGNPLFPAAVLGFDGPFDRTAQIATSLRPFLVSEPWNVLSTRMNWPFPLGVVLVLALLTSVTDRRRALLAAMGVIALLLLPFQPFSGTINRPGEPLNTIIRYLLPTAALAIACLSRPLGKLALLPPVLWVTVLALSTQVYRTGEIVGVILLLPLAASLWLWRPPPWPFAVVGVLAVVLATPGKRARTIEDRVRISRSTVYQHRLIRAVDGLPDGSVLTQLAEIPVAQDHSLRAFGTRFQHRYQPVDLDGSALRPLHERWRDEPDGWWWRFEAQTTPDFLHNLPHEIDYLLLSRCNQGKSWPAVRAQLLEHESSRIFKSKCGEIWDLSTLPL